MIIDDTFIEGVSGGGGQETFGGQALSPATKPSAGRHYRTIALSHYRTISL